MESVNAMNRDKIIDEIYELPVRDVLVISLVNNFILLMKLWPLVLMTVLSLGISWMIASL
jgi:hypothetical protein